MEHKFDIIISVGVKDIFIVKKTILYINQNINPSKIFLITNLRFFGFYSKKFLTANNVILLDESKLIPGVDINVVKDMVDNHFSTHFRAGWYFQQFLKIGFSLTEFATDYYLIWDADTIPTTPLSFFDENERMLLTLKDEYNIPYFDTMKRLTGLEKQVDKSFIAEHMIIKTSYMKELINIISHANIPGNTWIEKIINSTPSDNGLSFSEFETYGTWIYANHPESIAFRNLRTMRHAGRLFGRMIKRREIDEFRGVTDTISLEARDFPTGYRRLIQYSQLLLLRLLKP
jgi:hypothetical protein